MFVATYRDPDRPPDAPLADVIADLARAARTLPLFGLDRDAVAELIRATAGDTPSAGLAALVHDRTGGNPLFVIEVVKLLAARGGLNSGEVPIPASVRQVISHRLAYLSGEALDVLAAASVDGQVFSAAVLKRVTGEPAVRIADLLDEAVEVGLVHATPQLGRFTFTHALVREVLYAGIPSGLRRSRHRLVAEAIEALYPNSSMTTLASLPTITFSPYPTRMRAAPSTTPAVPVACPRTARLRRSGTALRPRRRPHSRDRG